MNAPGSILLAAFGNGHMNGGWTALTIIAMVVMMAARLAHGGHLPPSST